jgi:glycine dehydrogenase subunit 1
MHAASLGPDGLVELAQTCISAPNALAEDVNGLSGYRAPVHDRHHFREFQVHTDQPAGAIAGDLREEGFAVHAVDDHRLQLCVTDTNEQHTDDLVDALEVVR